MATVSAEELEDVVRDYTRAAKILIAIGLRILEEECDEPDAGLCPNFN
jgi:hypothetical protein